jgi:O-antigen/teichoic acid export membrane protein
MKEQTIRGSFWTLVDAAGGQVLSLLAFLVLARLLVPEDYGIVALATSILAIPGVLVYEGLADALIQRDDLQDRHINAAFWANLGLAGAFVLLAQISAGWIAEAAGEPLVGPAVRWLSLVLIPTAITSIVGAIYRRKFQYSTFALRTLIATASSAIVGVGMAAFGFGVWSLIVSQMVQAVVGVGVMWVGLKWRPNFEFSAAAFRDLYKFASHVMAGNALRFATDRIDQIIIGSFLSVLALGYYYMAQRLLTTINFMTISLVDNVMLPALSRMQDDRNKLIETYISMIWAAAILWVPTVAGLGLVSSHLVPVLFGHKWDAAVPVILIVSVTAASQALVRPTSQVLLAVGKPNVNVLINLIQLAITIVSFAVGVRYGIAGAAWAYTFTSFASIPFHLVALHRVVDVPVGRLLRRYSSVVAAGIVMSVAVFVVGEISSPGMGDWCFLVQIAAGAAVYAIALYGFAPIKVKELVLTVSQALHLTA